MYRKKCLVSFYILLIIYYFFSFFFSLYVRTDHLRHQKYKYKRFKNKSKIINISINDMDKFEKKELTKKKTFIKSIWYDWHDWLINYIPELIQNSIGGVEDQIMSLFKTKDYNKSEPVKTVLGGESKLSKPKIQNTKNPFLLKKTKKEIKYRIIRDIWKFFETEEEKKERKKL